MLFGGEGCGDPCGWLAAMIAALSNGSYGVPIKATSDMEVHPLVLQSYKTIVLFVLSFSVLLFGEEAKWTGYGILSGFLWVAGGACGIFGIRNAGMAVAVGTWSSVVVVVNFVWGILVFQEPVGSFQHTCVAFLVLGCGLVGMSKYAAVAKPPSSSRTTRGGENEMEIVEGRKYNDSEGLVSRRRADEEEMTTMLPSQDEDEEMDETNKQTKRPFHTVLMGIPLTPRELGILCSVFNGLLTGSSLIPMHFAKAQGFMGRSYILSLGSGALVANIFIWIAYYWFSYWTGSEGTTLWTTYDMMPYFHFKELWFKGFMAGLLLTVGMFGAIMAITYLGQGVGNSLVQTKILISGLWGIFWFKEVKDSKAISRWFVSASICVAAMLWLSYERSSATSKG